MDIHLPTVPAHTMDFRLVFSGRTGHRLEHAFRQQHRLCYIYLGSKGGRQRGHRRITYRERVLESEGLCRNAVPVSLGREERARL